jgi:TolB-like protein/Flp pilus assembly protein TadD
MPLPTGERLGPYEILNAIGAGGMGAVYRAWDSHVGREVAIKFSGAQYNDRFAREIRAVASLNHPNICTLHDVGPNYLVMELVEGETLRDWLKQVRPIERKLDVARQVLEGLRAAHRAGFVHRDLKPQNIMVRYDGYVKVLDFGLAKRMPGSVVSMENTATLEFSLPGQITGTFSYMSPEQVQGREVDARSDLFALGIILYEMFAGQHPWPRPSPVETLHAILHDEVPPAALASSARGELSSVVQKLLCKNPADRYETADAVLEALSSRGGGESAPMAHSRGPELRSVVVLPFVFLSEVEERQALSLGFADALITILGNLETVTVAPTSAIVKYPPGVPPAEVCRDLSVQYALQGNVQKLGAQWRVSVQLFDAATQRITLSEKYDFRLDNVFEVQDAIGQRVVGSLQGRFPATVAKSRDRYSGDPEAYNEFMAGMRESYSQSPEQLQRSAGHLARAVELDPEFALAHAWLSQVAMQIHFAANPQRHWLETAEEHCRRAFSLDPALPEAHWAWSAILWSPAKNFQHEQAITALEQVLQARPNFDRAHNRMAAICLHIGRLEEARQAHELAMRANPKNRSYNLEFIYICSGDFVRAEEAADVWLKEAPRSRGALWFYPQPPLYAGDLDLAAQRLEAGLQQLPDDPGILSLQGMLHAARGQEAQALECVRQALASPQVFGHAHHVYNQIACVYSVLGDLDKAMGWLEHTADTGNPCWPFFQIDPYLENLRRDGRFLDLVAKLERKYSALTIRRV